VLVCNVTEKVDPVLDALADTDHPERQQRLAAMRGRFPVARERLSESAEWQRAVAMLQPLVDTEFS
jgi:hypothetical protein